MNIITRHGFETPIATDLAEYQLGWSIDDGCLYIKDPQATGENKILRVVSDKALLESNFTATLKKILNDYSDSEIEKAKEELKKLYEKKTTYVIEFGLPLENERDKNVDYTKDTPFEYYTKNSADEAVTAFIKNLSEINEGSAVIGGQDPSISNAGSKIIISKADHTTAYLYIILEDKDGNEYGQLINTLEQSFPSLCIEWSEKKENVLEFKLNEEVLNSIDFSNIVIDEGSWEHNFGKLDFGQLIPGMKEYDYIHPISPICVRAVKNCKIKPTSVTTYGDIAYGYASNPVTKMENFQSNTQNCKFDSEGTVGWIISSKPITQKISDAVTRGKYYSVFRVKSGYGHGIPSFETIWNHSASYGTANEYRVPTFLDGHKGLVEVYNPKDKRWEFFVPYSSHEVQAANNNYAFGCAYPGVSWDAPTSSKPIIMNSGSSVNTLSNVVDFKCNLRRGWFKSESERNRFYNFTGTYNKEYFSFSEQGSNPYGLINTDNSPFYSTLYKIPLNELVPVDEGYDYVFLEALDYYSRAYWVPQYMNFSRTTVNQQLVDIFQIMMKNANCSIYYNSSMSPTTINNVVTSPTTFPCFSAVTYDNNSTNYRYDYQRSWGSLTGYKSDYGSSSILRLQVEIGSRVRDKFASIFDSNETSNYYVESTDTHFAKEFLNCALIRDVGYAAGFYANSSNTASSAMPCQILQGASYNKLTNYPGIGCMSNMLNSGYTFRGGSQSMVSGSLIYGFAKGLDNFVVLPRD